MTEPPAQPEEPATSTTSLIDGEPPPPERSDDFEGHDPLDDEPPPADVPPVVVPRWVQLVVLPLGVLGVWVVVRAAGNTLLLFVAAAVIALILNPAVSHLERIRLPRGVAILAVYLAFFATLVGVGFLLSSPISNQASKFQRDVPHIINSANRNLTNLQRFLNRKGVHVRLVKQGKTALQTLQDKVTGGTGSIVNFGGDLLKTIVTAGFHLILVFVVSVYMLIYGPRIGEIVREAMPPGDGTRDDDYPSRVQRAVSGYVRGQLLFSLIMGVTAALALYVFGLLGIFPAGKTYAAAFGVFFGVMELIPFIGPFLGALPPILVALFSDPISAIWVALLFLGLQQFEGHVVAPQIFGHTLRINPILVIFALLVGTEVAGFIGALLALPLAAVVRETAIYLRRHLVLEPWGVISPVAIAGAGAAPPALEAARCPGCGGVIASDDVFCRSCGASQRPDAVPSAQ